MKRTVCVLMTVVVLVAGCDRGTADPTSTTTTTSTTSTIGSTSTTVVETTTTLPGEPFMVVSILPTTGELARFGRGMERAIELAAEELADAGGLPGLRLELVSLDGSTPEAARVAAEEAVESGAIAVIGGASAEAVAALAGPLAESGVLVVLPSVATAPAATSPGAVVRVRPETGAEGAALAALVAGAGHDSVLVLSSGTPADASAAARLTAELSTATVATMTLPAAADDVAARALDGGVSAIVCLCTAGPPVEELMEAAGDLFELSWYFGSAMLDPTLPARVFPDSPGSLAGFRGVVAAGPGGTAYDRFAASYTFRFGDPPGSFAAEAYDAAWMVFLAVSLAGPDGDLASAIRDVAADGIGCSGSDCLGSSPAEIDYEGASGSVDLGPDGAPLEAEYRIWEFTESGGIRFMDD